MYDNFGSSFVLVFCLILQDRFDYHFGGSAILEALAMNLAEQLQIWVAFGK